MKCPVKDLASEVTQNAWFSGYYNYFQLNKIIIIKVNSMLNFLNTLIISL